ncbi:carbamoyl-phosphate synthase domain-containing protein, partial [Cellulosimicrobium composti]
MTASANAVTTPATGTDRALIVLEDGTVQTGRADGARGPPVGGVGLNTGMSGDQETLTAPGDPPQKVVMAAPPK